VQLYPLPQFEGTLESIYQQETYLSAIGPEEYRGYYRVVEEFLRADAGVGKNVSILDFGSGRSYYQKFFLEDGYREVHSLEINRHAVRFAREQLGLDNVFTSSSELPQVHYDVVVSNQVFEHLEHPIRMLETTIAPVLRDGGLVCLTLPNWDSANRRVLGKRWLGYSPEDHIWFFSEASIRKVLEDSDSFVVERTMIRSAVGKAYDGFRPRGVLRKLAYSLVMKRSERIGRGDQLIVLLRKRAG
jgi:SAM-dependent methyltransferase